MKYRVTLCLVNQVFMIILYRTIDQSIIKIYDIKKNLEKSQLLQTFYDHILYNDLSYNKLIESKVLDVKHFLIILWLIEPVHNRAVFQLDKL